MHMYVKFDKSNPEIKKNGLYNVHHPLNTIKSICIHLPVLSVSTQVHNYYTNKRSMLCN